MSARLAQPAPITRTRNKISSPFRATRFDLHLPLKYRLVGESGWREGTTENISRSGCFFRPKKRSLPTRSSKSTSCCRGNRRTGRGRSSLPG